MYRDTFITGSDYDTFVLTNYVNYSVSEEFSAPTPIVLLEKFVDNDEIITGAGDYEPGLNWYLFSDFNMTPIWNKIIIIIYKRILNNVF